jgi:gliding motility-associated-like protein
MAGTAQVPPAIQWQKCIGGTDFDGISEVILAQDGGFVICGVSSSLDGDFSGSNPGSGDAFVMKTDASGNILWRKNYGGTLYEVANNIIPTTDGRYIFIGNTGSADMDVVGYHPGATPGLSDVWVVKIDNNGVMQWNRCYGGPGRDEGYTIRPTPGGGYIIGAYVTKDGGDVSGTHGSGDLWVIRIDGAGTLQWQRAFGGTEDDFHTVVIPSTGGGYMLAGTMNSINGDVSCTSTTKALWLVKLDNTGNMQWQNCVTGDFVERTRSMSQTADGGYIIAGSGFLYVNPDATPEGYEEAYVMKCDVSGNVQWRRIIGGHSGQDNFNTVHEMADGTYIVAGSSNSTDGDICSNHGLMDAFIVKLNSDGSTNWRKTYGGSQIDGASAIIATPDGGFLVSGSTNSNDIEVSGNHGTNDGWLVKLGFPGVPVLPTISIEADQTTICPGQALTFVAEITEGGTAPLFQWQVNGINTGPNNDTVTINTLNDGDVVSCILTSNSRCVTDPTGLSNTIPVTVDPTLIPANFLFEDTAVCRYGTIDLKATGTYNSYLWNTNAVTPILKISQPGEYWLQVTTSTGCPGRDSVIVTQKECLRGIYVPTGFTPNNDGKNDLLKPTIGGEVLQYKFTIMNRWGEVVFQASDTEKGWDGRFKGLLQDGNVYVWTCSYQLAGEKLKLAKGTFVLIH